VPAVVGQTQADATAALTANSLNVGSISQVYDDHAAVGTVVRTDPPVGSQQRANTTVALFVSKGPQPVKVPAVVGQSRAQATAALTGAGLGVSVTTAYSDTAPSGTVISANPGAGQTVNHGSSVTLVVSKGPPPVVVPNVVGMKDTDAVAALQALGLKVSLQTVGAGTLHLVQTQSVPPNHSVPKFTTIILGVA